MKRIDKTPLIIPNKKVNYSPMYRNLEEGNNITISSKTDRVGVINANIDRVETPVITNTGGLLAVSCKTDGATIYYTDDGSFPSFQSTKYTEPIVVVKDSTFRFVAIKNGLVNSFEAVYNADLHILMPNITLDHKTGTVVMTNPNYVGSIYYTIDGSTPTDQSTPYEGPIVITNETTFKAIVVGLNESSDIATVTYHKLLSTFGVPDYDFDSNICTVDISASADNAAIHVTTDGSTPSYASLESKSVATDLFGNVITVKAIAICEGFIPSDVITMQLGIDKPSSPIIMFDNDVNLVTMSGQNWYDPAYMDIYYTTDGSTPTRDNGIMYNAQFNIPSTCTVKAVVLYRVGRIYSNVTEMYCVFNPLVEEDNLADEDVALIYKSNSDGALRYLKIEDQGLINDIDANKYTLKDFIRFDRGKRGRSVAIHKNSVTSSLWACDNLYILHCDLTNNGSFNWSVTVNGYQCGGSVSWDIGATLEDIVRDLRSGVHSSVSSTYLNFSVYENEIRIRQRTRSDSELIISNSVGAELYDLSKYCRINGVLQGESHRTWQAQDVASMFPNSVFLPANTVQYARSGINLSYRCGCNESKYKDYYRISGSGHGGVDRYLPENDISGRMSVIGFNSLEDSEVQEQQQLYDKYLGSWDNYINASMIKIDSEYPVGIEYQSYDNGDVQSGFLRSVETKDFSGNWVKVFVAADEASKRSDIDLGIGNMPTNHEIAVFMSDERMSKINQAISIIGGNSLSNSAYYWSVAQYHPYGSWLFNGVNGTLYYNTKYVTSAGRALAYLN